MHETFIYIYHKIGYNPLNNNMIGQKKKNFNII